MVFIKFTFETKCCGAEYVNKPKSSSIEIFANEKFPIALGLTQLFGRYADIISSSLLVTTLSDCQINNLNLKAFLLYYMVIHLIELMCRKLCSDD